MSFIVVIAVFGLFVLGLAFAIQGFVGKEIYPEGRPFAVPWNAEHPGIEHPPEKHRLRLFLIGVAMMVGAVVLGVVLS